MTKRSNTSAAADHATRADHVDVVVVGAGLSGIGAAYRLQTESPGRSYTILEARDAIGGTWDLFRYPGIRSDSDMFTLGYPFKPWTDEKSIADGGKILSYIRETADENGITDKIRFSTKVVSADFSTSTSLWNLTLSHTGADGTVTEQHLTCSFLYSCAGYYDYDHPYAPQLTGIDDFAGQVVHPQFWPDDLDHAGKKVVVIGSGATAVTLVPTLAREAEHVTMLQRTPTWISPVPGRDKKADAIRKVLPPKLAHQVVRTKNIAFGTAFYQFCRLRPQQAGRLLNGLATKILGDEQMVAEHFTPTYNPWDQRLCAIPNADLFVSIKKGDASVVTAHIDTFVPEGVRLQNGDVIEADIVVTATGLQLLAFGGIEPHVDGELVDLSQQFVWQGAMISGIPNFAVCIGYTNASWTLRADLSSRLVCKVLNWMDKKGYAAVAPVPEDGLKEQPLLDLSAGYVQRSIAAFPKQGHKGPWRVRQNYVIDANTTLRAHLDRDLAPVVASVPADLVASA